jgi:hypothetical protein
MMNMRKDINMQRLKLLLILIAFFSVSSLINCTQVHADLLDNIQIIKIAPKDERAIVKMPEGEMKIIRVGDQIGDSGKIVEITKGRVIVEEKREKGIETVIIRLENGKQTIERIKRTPDKQPEIYKTN